MNKKYRYLCNTVDVFFVTPSLLVSMLFIICIQFGPPAILWLCIRDIGEREEIEGQIPLLVFSLNCHHISYNSLYRGYNHGNIIIAVVIKICYFMEL